MRSLGLFACLLLLLATTACAPESPLAPLAPARPRVTLQADGQTRTFETGAQTVRQFLEEASVSLGPDDRITPSEPTLISDGLVVTITRVLFRVETEQRTIPFERQTVRDASVQAGETRLLQSGINGLEEIAYRITVEDGVEVNRQEARRTTLQAARPEIWLVGVQVESGPVPLQGSVVYLAGQDAWIMRTSSASRRRLTHSGDLDGRAFDLSPEGTRLLFTRLSTETGTINTLWALDTSTVDAQPVQLAVEDVLWAAWAPDGARVAFSTGEATGGNPSWQARNDLWVARPRLSDGVLLERRQVLEPSAGGSYGWWGTEYAWAPNGSYLAYARSDEVGVVNVESRRLAPLAQFPVYHTYSTWVWTPSLSWSPDGRFVVTTLHGPAPDRSDPEDSPVFDLWTLETTLSTTVKLARETGMWAVPTYAQDSGAIAFGRARVPYSSQTSTYDLLIMDRDGSNRHLVFPAAGEPGLNYPLVAWGPDGEQLLTVYQGGLWLIELGACGVLVDDEEPCGVARSLTREGNVSQVHWRWPNP